MLSRALVLASRCGVGAGLGLALAWWAWPGPAGAANTLHARSPAIFPADLPCVQTIEKGDVLHVDYAVAADDTALTPDELPDSRRHQFFAFAEERFDFQLPLWVNQADYDRAEANGDIVQYADRPILDSDPSWPAGTWVRITPDDARLPVTMEQAAMGVDWDTTDTPPGTWIVATYTWEPEQNIWTHRLGAVRIVDPADPAATGPTVFLQPDTSALLNVGESYAPPGCIEAPAGSTMTASWGLVTSGMEPQWQTFAEDVPADTGALALAFTPPDEAAGSVKLRVEITDPDGRSYVAYSPTALAVFGGAGDGPMEDGGDTEGGDGGRGCQCTGAVSPPTASTMLLGLVLVGLARRDRAMLWR